MTNKTSSGQVKTPTATRCNAVKFHIIVHMQAPVLFFLLTHTLARMCTSLPAVNPAQEVCGK